MEYEIDLPTEFDRFKVTVPTGSSILLVGANGTGKTRLAAYIENIIGEAAHRISAHRALTINPSAPKVSEDLALKSLRYGFANPSATLAHRPGQRWKSKAAVSLLSDYDFLLQALFADQSNVALKTHNRVRAGSRQEAQPTNFERLKNIWQRLLPHRTLEISGDAVNVKPIGSQLAYSAADMSDGERAMLYLIGQALTAAPNSLLIVDEPELHVHKSLVAKLWDEIEAARPDCAYIFITHDLDFASSRACKKYVVYEYFHADKWNLEEIEDNDEFSEELCTLILGSRRPILFVEGDGSSLDKAIYRCCYPEWTVIPRGSCEDVIRSVVSMRNNAPLTRLNCSGIVDADDHSASDKERLNTLGISVLPVSEIENIFLIPEVSRAIAEIEGYQGAELESKLNELSARTFTTLETEGTINALAIRFCKRRIDRQLKLVDLGAANDIADLSESFSSKMQDINIDELAQYIIERVDTAKAENNIADLMSVYDNKGLMAIAGSVLKNCRKHDFENWITRTLASKNNNKLKQAIEALLPAVG